MTNYKQLCAELIDALDSGIPSARIRSSPLANRARAALAKTEPGEPTDEELLCIAAEAIDGYGNCGIKPGEYEEVTEQAVEAYGSELIAYARAVLARWGNHPGSPDSSLQPIPVSERMPGPEDCNSEEKAMRPQQQQEGN